MNTAFAPLTRDEARQNLAWNLRRLFEQRGTSARALGRETGLCYRSIQRVVHGASDPAASLVINVARALSVSVESLFAPPETAPASAKKTAKA